MRWIYKTVHYELKKEGLLGSAFLDESEMEESLNEYGKAGWELISTMESHDGILAIFKQPFGVVKSGSPRIRKQTNIEPRQQTAVMETQEEFILVDDDTDEGDDDREIGVIRIE